MTKRSVESGESVVSKMTYSRDDRFYLNEQSRLSQLSNWCSRPVSWRTANYLTSRSIRGHKKHERCSSRALFSDLPASLWMADLRLFVARDGMVRQMC
ncbi:hypothetical protein Mal48_25140 [Thalassoglobus polymorphus]|uniref:Uncharacterized protein n=1 Tax=Thalassoglobus polymorphus TaxID=2527994 RepID=A0A517QNR0_9PLAN|nr:hypothetical protein Mal48_25140 [Thalassoglobus polymorphus]